MKDTTTAQESGSSRRCGMDAASLAEDFRDNLRYTLAKDRFTATDRDRYFALALAVRDRLVERWIATQQAHHAKNVKRIYYLSLEFLMGRLLGNNVINLGLDEICDEAMQAQGLSWRDLRDFEKDAGLGNGGLGRLAACFLDSMSTLDLPAVGYGLRYEYGIFKQLIVGGRQVEEPDAWLKDGYPWELARPEYSVEVQFGGRVEARHGQAGTRHLWVDTDQVVGMPYDIPVVGYGGGTVNNLRLWSARATEEFNFEDFNRGSYVDAVVKRVFAENLTKVLYPNDNIPEGKDLRLRQQYFFVACSLHDILRRFKVDNDRWEAFPDKVFVQLNDTHPALAIPELMRLLVDVENLDWDRAWRLTQASMGYTNHTLLPEALECWPVSMLETLLPRHLQIIYEINARFLAEVSIRYPMDTARLRRMSLVEEGHEKRIRMANLAVVGSCSVNGVAALHTRLLKERVLRDFAELWPERFNNKTNGVTPRRWILKANPGLAELLTEAVGDGWIRDLSTLSSLAPFAEDPAFRARFRDIKQENKRLLADHILDSEGIAVDVDAIFDVQIKRLHEYKRQLMLVLYIIMLYSRLKEAPDIQIPPRVFIFGAKAAPGYWMAKLIIHLIHKVAEVINRDPAVEGRIKVIFLPNYRVSLAERIIPATNVSEQISLAGLEASGTGNMKFQMNGALTVGTLDGANIEILEEVGEDNIFIFGMTADEVAARRAHYNPWEVYHGDAEIKRVVDLLDSDFFCMMQPGTFRPIVESLLEQGDPYMVLADLRAFAQVQEAVSVLYQDPDAWDRRAILNVAFSGKFSSDRTIRQYAEEIWGVTPCQVRG